MMNSADLHSQMAAGYLPSQAVDGPPVGASGGVSAEKVSSPELYEQYSQMSTAPDSYEQYIQMSDEHLDGQQTEPARKAVTGSREAKTLRRRLRVRRTKERSAWIPLT